jgi:hypothetical protein
MASFSGKRTQGNNACQLEHSLGNDGGVFFE